MPGAHFYTAASFVTEHRNEITAVATLVLAIVVAELVDRMLARRGKRVQEALALSPVADTRLRLIRRLIFATIVVLGIGFALIQFPSVKRVATGVLASSAVLGIVVGFAARQTLANGVAGIMLAITQPIRIGDLVTVEDETGEVEDVRLTYTYIRLDDGRRLVVPNELLASSSIDQPHGGRPASAGGGVRVAAAGRRPGASARAPGRRGRGRGERRGDGQGGRPAEREDLGRQRPRARIRGRRTAPNVASPPPRGGSILNRGFLSVAVGPVRGAGACDEG